MLERGRKCYKKLLEHYWKFYRATADTAIDLTNLMCNANTGSFPCFTFCFNGDYSRNDQSCYEVFIECGKNMHSDNNTGLYNYNVFYN